MCAPLYRSSVRVAYRSSTPNPRLNIRRPLRRGWPDCFRGSTTASLGNPHRAIVRWLRSHQAIRWHWRHFTRACQAPSVRPLTWRDDTTQAIPNGCFGWGVELLRSTPDVDSSMRRCGGPQTLTLTRPYRRHIPMPRPSRRAPKTLNLRGRRSSSHCEPTGTL